MLVLGLVAAGLALAGCGGDEEGKPIPTATATALHAQLDNIQGRLDQGSAGACKDILEGPREPNMEQVSELIDAMPDDVDSDVRSALEDSFDNLWELVQDDCDDKAQAEEKARQDREQQQEEEPDTDTETTPTETETDTTPTDTTPTDTTPTTPGEEPLPPEGDGDNGGQVPGNSGGAGTGGGAGAEGL
jgi:hypothetical protein